MSEVSCQSSRKPVSAEEFAEWFDSDGRLVKELTMRQRVFEGTCTCMSVTKTHAHTLCHHHPPKYEVHTCTCMCMYVVNAHAYVLYCVCLYTHVILLHSLGTQAFPCTCKYNVIACG